MYFKLAGVLAALSLGLAGYYYVNNLQDQVIELSKANAIYSETVKDLRFSIEGIQDNVDADRIRLDKAYVEMRENRKEVADIQIKLSKHDLEKIIQRKPKLFEKIAQKGTDKYYEDLRELSEWSDK